MGYANIGSVNRGNKIMDRRVNKEEIIGNCDRNRKVAEGDNAAEKEGDKGGGFHCDGDECQIEWTDD